ncbi:type II secretion system F family protein [Phenylobacterium sp.]|jgi:tight adherence protein C|uniref:type II secretion system F family protein n=1 Tax=Phenylobacterium sp. TaxID=1871053 RepID=UPI002F95BBAE
MAQAFFYLTSVLAILSLAAAVGALTLGDRAFNARLATLSGEAPADESGPKPKFALSPAFLKTLIKWGEKAGKGSLDTEKRADLRMRLVQAGFYSERAVEAFFGIRAMAALALAALALVAVLVMNVASLLWIAGLIMLGANIGLFLPNFVLSSRIKERSDAVYRGLPDAIDLMVVSLEAGATLSAALQRVEQEFRDLHPVLTEQIGIMLDEMQAGASRAEALVRFAQRTPSDEVRALTTSIVQSEAVGASLGDTLRIFADDMRKTRFMDAERKAAELPVKIAFPLVFCIFPCLCGVLFIPVVIRMMHSLFDR